MGLEMLLRALGMSDADVAQLRAMLNPQFLQGQATLFRERFERMETQIADIHAQLAIAPRGYAAPSIAGTDVIPHAIMDVMESDFERMIDDHCNRSDGDARTDAGTCANGNGN